MPKVAELIHAAKAVSEARLDRVLVLHKDNKYSIFLDQKTILQVDNGVIVAQNLFNLYAARIVSDALAVLIPEARVVKRHILIGDQIV